MGGGHAFQSSVLVPQNFKAHEPLDQILDSEMKDEFSATLLMSWMKRARDLLSSSSSEESSPAKAAGRLPKVNKMADEGDYGCRRRSYDNDKGSFCAA